MYRDVLASQEFTARLMRTSPEWTTKTGYSKEEEDAWRSSSGEDEIYSSEGGHRTALTNAGSIAALMLTTEALVADITEEKKGSPSGGHGGMGDMY
jgi:chaperonin GroEL (HSP60 family)